MSATERKRKRNQKDRELLTRIQQQIAAEQKAASKSRRKKGECRFLNNSKEANLRRKNRELKRTSYRAADSRKRTGWMGRSASMLREEASEVSLLGRQDNIHRQSEGHASAQQSTTGGNNETNQQSGAAQCGRHCRHARVQETGSVARAKFRSCRARHCSLDDMDVETKMLKLSFLGAFWTMILTILSQPSP